MPSELGRPCAFLLCGVLGWALMLPMCRDGECSQEVAGFIWACQSSDPRQRPTAKQCAYTIVSMPS